MDGIFSVEILKGLASSSPLAVILLAWMWFSFRSQTNREEREAKRDERLSEERITISREYTESVKLMLETTKKLTDSIMLIISRIDRGEKT